MHDIGCTECHVTEVCLVLHGHTIYYGSQSKGRGVAAALIEVGIPLLQCMPLVLISWVRMGYLCLRSTTRYYLLVHPLSNHICPPIQLQHTDEHTESSRHYPLPKSQHTPLLHNPSCQQAVELALNGTHNNFSQIICYLLISARTLLVQEPGTSGIST